MFICPICKKEMTKTEGAFVCPENHSFDISRRGYVNLLCSQSSKLHGDDKQMATSRRDFLNHGYYKRLLECICSNITEGPVADIGCGEGYYLEGINRSLCSRVGTGGTVGIDISKPSVDAACRRSYACENNLAVASCKALPLGDNSIAAAVSVFAPVTEAEVGRVLRPGGKLIRVVPGRDHLIELKRAVYENAQLNPPFDNTLAGFELKSAENLRYTMHLDENADIRNLFSMTPYAYRTGERDKQKLRSLSGLDITAHFYIFVYEVIK